MKAFVEILSGVVRCGPEAERYGSPFDFSVAFSAHANFATLKGLSLNRKLTRADYRAVFAACRELGLEPIYERIKS